MRTFVASLALAASAIGLASMAHAAIIPTLTSVNPTLGGYAWAYQGTLASDQALTSGDRLIIFDFAGFTGTFLNPYAGLVNTSAEFLTNPEGTLLPFGSGGFTDDPNVYNLVFTYVGPNVNIAPDSCCTQRNFDGIGAVSTFNQIVVDGFAGSATLNQGQQAGNTATNFGSVQVPGVPEPATWGMMLIGFGAIGAAMRRRRRELNHGRLFLVENPRLA
jgi:hypothetical protein